MEMRFVKSRRFLTAICAALFAVTLLWLGKVKWPLGVKGEWQIVPNAGPWPLPAWGLPLAVLFIFGGLAALSAYDRFRRAKSEKEKRGSTRLCVLALTVLAFTWPWALLGPGGTSNLIASQWSDISNEYFGAAYNVENAREFSKNYAAKSQTPQSVLQAHVATHPPGAVLFYYGAKRIYELSPFLQSSFDNLAVSLTNESIEDLSAQSNQLRTSAERAAGVENPDGELPASAVGAAMWCAFLISLLLASCVPATFFIASIAENTGAGSTPDIGEARGMTAAALLALAPVLSLFAFTLDALIACGAAWTMAFIALRLRGGKKHWLIFSGGAMALTSFISFGALAIAAIAIIALLFARRRAALSEIALFGVGFIALWLALIVIFPMQPLSIFQKAMAMHRFATVESRSRGAWLGMNIVSYAVFCGWPLFMAALAGGAHFLRVLWREKAVARERLSTPVVIGAAALVTMLLLTASGSARGEVERLWLFLTPSLATIAAAHLMQRSSVKNIGVLLALQAAQTIVMAAWLAPLVRPL
jgi:hypothetical protein